MDTVTWGAARLAPRAAAAPVDPHTILVLRNNDIGDLIAVTPLFEALKTRFPAARILAGIGDWNRPVLANSPHVDGIVPINAPWHNKVVANQSPIAAARYIARSAEARHLAALSCDLGIDVLGSAWGSLLMMRAGIPWRLGVRGYAGGDLGVQQHVAFDAGVHVGRAALRFAELLGASALPAGRPRLYLTADEEMQAEKRWQSFHRAPQTRRVIVGPGGGYSAKCWPLESFAALVRQLSEDPTLQIAIVGSGTEVSLGRTVAAATTACDLVGQTPLRELFALVSRADAVVCNSSMLMHAAAAFGVPAVALLGEDLPPAREHAALWGYPGITMVCGRESATDSIFSVPAALNALTAALQHQHV